MNFRIAHMDELASIVASYDADQVVILADETVADTAERFLPSGMSRCARLLLSQCEQMKSTEGLQRVWDFLFDHSITRRGLLVCIGGGSVSDLGGLAAATYLRGIDYITVPTTLLAMVDASAGGKTAINYRGLKNAIGAFHTPVTTVIDTRWLATLPVREFLSGYAEMLKTGLIDATDRLWPRLLQFDINSPFSTLDSPLSALITDCLAAKQRVVEADPREAGLRKALNLGHTFGHALEELSSLPHGYAVLYGLIAELYLSVTVLGCPREPLQQLTQLMLHYYGCPQCKCSDLTKLITLMQQDKKNEHAAEINCTLIRRIGEPVINQTISPDQALEAWEYLFSL